MCAVSTSPNAIPVSLERGKQQHNTEQRAYAGAEDAQKTQQPSAEQRESGPAPIRSKAAPCEKTDNSGKVTGEDYRPEEAEIASQWWRETCAKDIYNKGGALRYVGATAVLRVDETGSLCRTLLNTVASRNFISPETVE